MLPCFENHFPFERIHAAGEELNLIRRRSGALLSQIVVLLERATNAFRVRSNHSENIMSFQF